MIEEIANLTDQIDSLLTMLRILVATAALSAVAGLGLWAYELRLEKRELEIRSANDPFEAYLPAQVVDTWMDGGSEDLAEPEDPDVPTFVSR